MQYGAICEEGVGLSQTSSNAEGVEEKPMMCTQSKLNQHGSYIRTLLQWRRYSSEKYSVTR